MSEKLATIVTQNDGLVLHAFGEEVTIHLDGERTAGELTVWTELTPPGGGPPPHYHLNEDETFHVLEGRVAFLLNGEWNELGPGETAFMPRKVIHTFKNVGDHGDYSNFAAKLIRDTNFTNSHEGLTKEVPRKS